MENDEHWTTRVSQNIPTNISEIRDNYVFFKKIWDYTIYLPTIIK